MRERNIWRQKQRGLGWNTQAQKTAGRLTLTYLGAITDCTGTWETWTDIGRTGVRVYKGKAEVHVGGGGGGRDRRAKDWLYMGR